MSIIIIIIIIKIGTEVDHVTRDSEYSTFKVKGQLAGAGHILAASCTACYNCFL